MTDEEEPLDVDDADEEEEEEEGEEDLNDFGEIQDMVESPPLKTSVVKKAVASSSVQQVVLPHSLNVIEDSLGYKYIQAEVELLSGHTEDTIHASVDKSGRKLNIKYYHPSHYTDAARQDGDLLARKWLQNTNLETVCTKKGRVIDTAFSNERVYCQQQIKLPFACERNFSKAYGAEAAYVRMIEHEVEMFANNKQFYYTLVIYLEAVEKPNEIIKQGPRFFVASKPASRKSEPVNPFESPVAVPEAPTSDMNTDLI